MNVTQCSSVVHMYQNEPILEQTLQAVWGILMANGVSVDMGKSGTYLKKNEAMDEEANRILQAFSKDALVYLILFGIVPFYVIKEGDGRAVL